MLAYISGSILVCYPIQKQLGYSALSHHIDVFTIANALDQLDVSDVKATPDGERAAINTKSVSYKKSVTATSRRLKFFFEQYCIQDKQLIG